MKFRIERKLDSYKQDRLIIQVKKWFGWRDLFWVNDLEPDGWEFYQIKFNIDEYLKASEFIKTLENNPNKLKEYFIYGWFKLEMHRL